MLGKTAGMTDVELIAADGLTARVIDGVVRVGFAGRDDWFGPGTFEVGGSPSSMAEHRDIGGVDDIGSWRARVWIAERSATPRLDLSLAAYEDVPIITFSVRAPSGIAEGLATGTFHEPSVAWPAFRPSERIAGGCPEDASGFGFQYMEFALPTATDAGLAEWTRWPFRPPVIMPLLLVSSSGTLMVAPLDHFHEQVVAVPEGDEAAGLGVRCGWHGDLESVPAGFGTEMAIVAGADARECLDRWAAILSERAGTRRLPRGIDTVGRSVSYWTDNGAAYWYRTEGDRSVTETLVDTLDDLRGRDVPFSAVQLDSWFYPHRSIRPFDTDEWDVPPTGLERWEARDDILPDGVAALREALGSPPLVVHCRHVSSDSPYLAQHEFWVDGEYAHPVGPELYEAYFDQCLAWGVETFEHDWLVECFLGVRGLRAAPGRAAAWQQGIDAALERRGLTAQWCMATPADFMQSASLRQVTSIRTSGDHGYLVPPELLWAWFLYTNAMARPLGLWPYKDVFRSDGHGGSTDPGAEAALAALSGGPVGIGDALGGADRDLVLRTARRDGILVAPDAPVAAIARCFARHGVLQDEPVIGATHSAHDAGTWSYVITMNCHDGSEAQSTRVTLDELGADRPVDAQGEPVSSAASLDWRRGTVEVVGPEGVAGDLGAKGWDLRVLAPLLAGGRLAVFGDADRYASAGVQRVSDVRDVDGTVHLALSGAGEPVRLVGWSDAEQVAVDVVTGSVGAVPVSSVVRPDATGRWELVVDLAPEPGRATVELRV